ncbi:MAG: hypothetical protein GVY29_02010 [Spirochaetes bacterium]|jgi:hypothetical protein|nr:hypothetical protein [Spirochaetota bacterium]
MKYELQTIPIWNAYSSDDDCPLCHLETKLEKDYQRFFLGNSVMAPDIRIEINAKGFCRHHYRLLYAGENKLGLALLAQTRLEERRRTFTRVMREAQGMQRPGWAPFRALMHALRRVLDAVGVHRRGAVPGTADQRPAAAPQSPSTKSDARNPSRGPDPLEQAAGRIEADSNTCVICERLERSLANYAFSIVSLYERNPEFEKTFRDAKGFCFSHLPLMLRMAEIVLPDKSLRKWTEDLVASQERALQELAVSLEELAGRYDYRSTEGVTPELRQVLPRALTTLGGPL